MVLLPVRGERERGDGSGSTGGAAGRCEGIGRWSAEIQISNGEWAECQFSGNPNLRFDLRRAAWGSCAEFAEEGVGRERWCTCVDSRLQVDRWVWAGEIEDWGEAFEGSGW